MSAPPLPAEQKRQRRLEKNREIAKRCRKRKREQVGQLQEEVLAARERHAVLQQRLQLQGGGGGNGDDASGSSSVSSSSSSEQARQRELNEMVEMVKRGGAEDELRRRLMAYQEVHADFGERRRQAVGFHLEQLRGLLVPNQVSKMTLWSLQQEDDFYDESTNSELYGGGIWNLLCAELGLTSEQKNELLRSREVVRGQQKKLGESLKMLRDMEQEVDHCLCSMADQMTEIIKMVTPSQMAKYLAWVENNQPFMQMLSYINDKPAEEEETV